MAERLRKMGIEPVAYDICASQPDKGDYLSAMNANAERVTAAMAKTK